MTDTAVAKFNMINQQIRPWEVLDSRVLSVLEEVERERFVDEAYRGLAYADCQIPIADGVRMLPPTVEGRMLQALLIQADDRVLEVGCGCGFITACLAHLAARVSSIDAREAVVELARGNLADSGLDNIELRQASFERIEDEQAYDVITVTASLPEVPQNLRRALAVGGRLFVVVGDSPAMEAMLVTRVGESEWSTQSLFETDLPRLNG